MHAGRLLSSRATTAPLATGEASRHVLQLPEIPGVAIKIHLIMMATLALRANLIMGLSHNRGVPLPGSLDEAFQSEDIWMFASGAVSGLVIPMPEPMAVGGPQVFVVRNDSGSTVYAQASLFFTTEDIPAADWVTLKRRTSYGQAF